MIWQHFSAFFCNALDCAGESCTAKLLTAEAEHDTGRAIGFVSVCSFAVLGFSPRQSLVEPALGSVGSCWWWAVPVVGAVRHDAEAQKSRVFHNRIGCQRRMASLFIAQRNQNKKKRSRRDDRPTSGEHGLLPRGSSACGS